MAENNLTESFDLLYAEIAEYSAGLEIYYFPNPGNWGDSLIREGFEEFAARYGLSYKAYDRLSVRPRRSLWGRSMNSLRDIRDRRRGILIYGGGGGWCQNWHHSVREVHRAARLFDRVIVLPSTYEVAPLGTYDNVLFFSRDHFRSREVNPSSKFCHDMAFFLQERILRAPVAKDRERGHFFRVDTESAGQIVIPNDNVDLSAQGVHDTPIDGFLKEVGRCQHVLTDRLHVAIAGAMLGCKVDLYPGNYFKNEAIYRSSLEPFFGDSVRFMS